MLPVALTICADGSATLWSTRDGGRVLQRYADAPGALECCALEHSAASLVPGGDSSAHKITRGGEREGREGEKGKE